MSRARVHRSDGLPFTTLSEAKGTGLYAEWRDDGTLAALRFLKRGKVLVDGDERREIVFESDTKVRSIHGESWSDGLHWDSYAGAFESYEPSTVTLLDFLKGQVKRLDEPTRKEIDAARARRGWLGAVLIFAAVGVLLRNFPAVLDWFMTLHPTYGPFAMGLAMCVVLPVLAFGPQLKPVIIRGRRIPDPSE